MPRKDYDDEQYDDEPIERDEEFDDGPRGLERVRQEAEQRDQSLKGRLGTKSAHPDEQDIVRSPIILILTGTAVVLVLLAAIYGFMIVRESARREFDAAKVQMDQGSYAVAIAAFESFLETHPEDHELVPEVRILMGKSRIMQQVNSATPNWTEGLAAIEEFRKKAQDLEGFADLKPELREFSEKVARGAAEQALGQTGDNLLSKSGDLITVSKSALSLVSRYSPADEKPEELERTVKELNRQTEAKILRQQTFVDAIKQIGEQLENKQPIDALDTRRSLLEQYGDFASNRQLSGLMEDMLKLEISLITVEEINRDAPAVPERNDLPSLSLSLQTRARNDDVASGRLVIAVARNCCYGIDMTTGEPVWRQVIGVNPPFFPVSVSASVPGLLVYNSRLGALILLERETGRVIWQQPLAEEITGTPVIEDGQIYLTTQSSHLYKINLESGRITLRTRFSQPVLSPPVVMDKYLIVGGELSVVYTVDPRTLKPQQVSFIGQNPGTVRAPMRAMGALVLMAENRTADSSQLHVMRWNAEDLSLSEAASETVEGAVIDPTVIRGNQLFVPSTGRRITAFSVSDDPDSPPLTRVAGIQLEGEFNGPMFLDAGPDGQVWLASSALRRMEVRSRTINLDPNSTAEGLTSQPLQQIGDQLYMGRRTPFSDAVFFSQIDRTTLTGYWRIVLGAPILGTTAVENGSLIAVTGTGHIYRINQSDLDAGGFLVETMGVLRLPENLATPLSAAPLIGNRLAVYCGGDSPQMWIVSAVGQVEKTVALPAALEAAPVAIGRGVIAAIPGRLKIVGGPSGTSRSEDYVAPVEPARRIQWKSMASIDETQVVAVDDAQRLLKLQYRRTPVPSLSEVARMNLEAPADTPLVVDQGRVYLVDGKARLLVLDVNGFETVASQQLQGNPSGGVWLAGDLALVETDGRSLQAFRQEGSFEPAWSLPLDGGAVAGDPLRVEDLLYIVQLNGTVQVVNAADGKVKSTLQLAQAFGEGPFVYRGQVLLPAMDGTIYRIDAAGEETVKP